MGRPTGIPRAKIHYGKRYEVSAWVPSAAQVEAANERIEGMVGYFLSCCERFNAVRWQDELYTLARSCYLQGATDTAAVAAKMIRDKVAS